ncbi:MAG TPA: serine/threonine-protein kinase [Gemmatimonadaceae bacterium]|nr:serine/threonine-protein kinase [Gemmatimonadaceae bacterium]
MALSPARRAEIEEVFEHALDLRPDQRGAWLSDRCARDAELRAKVDGLLAAHDLTTGILERRLTPATTSLATEALLDRRIGPYRVVRELGRGGMGVVYLAERDDGEFRREVAIKLLRNSPDAEELHRRFIAERQILASLSHPHIAQLLDGGTTDGQLPYLVMEYVDGLPITTYCDRHGLDIVSRLRLFVDVCRAVNSAHQNLIIHRDIKPGNILVTASGQVKLLDFGIAKLLNSAMGGMAVPHTRTAFRVMTPDYASPEQVRGEPLTTGSDVYALGVVLYELLAGRRPYQIRTGAVRELHELVCEREPERPSTWATRAPLPDEPDAPAPAEIASGRGTTPERLRRVLAGDLDAIVMMALRKEPRRRYGSAELLAEDIERYLHGLPVIARHPSRAYYLGKFLGRHRTAASLGTIAVLSLVASTAVAIKQTATARRERDRATAALTQARQALHESDETTSFLAGLFDVNVPAPGGAPPGTTEELIARGMGQIEQLGNSPLVQARMLEGIGRIYQNAGRFAEAKQSYERSLVLRRANGAGESAEAATTLLQMANTLRVTGSYPAADSAAWQALRIYEKVNGPADPSAADAWQMLSKLAVYRSDLRATEAYARRSADIMVAAYGADDPRAAYSLEMLGGAVHRLGRYEEGERYMRRAFALYEREKGPNDPELIVPLFRLAEAVASGRQDYAEAARLMERGVAISRAALGEAHPRTAYALDLLGGVESRRGNFAKAEQLSRRAIEIFEKTIGQRDVSVADAYADLAKVYSRVGRWTEAEAAQRTAMTLFANVLGSAHPMYAGAKAGLCEIHLHAGRVSEAEAECRESLAMRERAQGSRNLGLLNPLMLLGDMRVARGELAAADSFYSAALSIAQERVGEPSRPYDYLYPRIAVLRDLQHRPAEAAELRRKVGGKPVRSLDF